MVTGIQNGKFVLISNAQLPSTQVHQSTPGFMTSEFRVLGPCIGPASAVGARGGGSPRYADYTSTG
jgi:hypothetical protein